MTDTSKPAPLTAGKSPNFDCCSLDRLSFTGDFIRRKIVYDTVPGPFGKPTKLKQDATILQWSTDVGLLEKTPAKFPYRWNFKHLLGYFIQIAEKTSPVKPVRVDCNPSKYTTKKSKPVFLDSIRKLTKNLCDIGITRMDFAIDFNIDLSKFSIISTDPKIQILYLDRSGEMMTHYLGSNSSPVRYRIYNKAKEQGRTDLTWWRVEVQYRFSKDFKWTQITPFSDLRIFKLEYQDDWKEKVILQHLCSHPETFGEMKDSTRQRYRRKLKHLATEGLHDRLQDIFTRDSPALINQLVEILEV